uniref:Septumpromoting GTPbinding protein 1 putative n=1 Tax=Albugo laibachii Nc14 TaxID=890382 RepID=F0W5Z2_9STRA|nr:septumpromoting GTPbinding protein 1 putative [Albugo laibachii Nc14]|eukprot:CCA16533.1 septumpromoting GTPbinding protein 1 putative [Albugo laibachii Nc14]
MKDLLIYRYAEPTIITGIHPDSIESHLLRYYAIESGHREFISMLPLVCNDAVAILFMFDLSRKATLTSIKEWYRQVRSINKNAFPFLVGMKYDVFSKFNVEEQEDITKQVRLLH